MPMTQIISVHSFRGGTGKSNCSANLAAWLAGQGKKVGVIDTDIQSPGVHVLFNFDGAAVEHSLNDYLWGECGISDCTYEVSSEAVKKSGGGVFLVPCAMRAGDIAKVLREGYEVARLVDGIRDLNKTLGLDVLLIDTHPGINEETLLCITISDVLLIVLRPDRQDYLGTAVAFEVAQKLGVPDILFLVNKVPAGLDLDAVCEKVADSYGAQVLGAISQDEEMARLGSESLVVDSLPENPVSVSIAEMARKIAVLGERD